LTIARLFKIARFSQAHGLFFLSYFSHPVCTLPCSTPRRILAHSIRVNFTIFSFALPDKSWISSHALKAELPHDFDGRPAGAESVMVERAFMKTRHEIIAVTRINLFYVAARAVKAMGSYRFAWRPMPGYWATFPYFSFIHAITSCSLNLRYFPIFMRGIVPSPVSLVLEYSHETGVLIFAAISFTVKSSFSIFSSLSFAIKNQQRKSLLALKYRQKKPCRLLIILG